MKFEQPTLLKRQHDHVYKTPSGHQYPGITTILSHTRPEFAKTSLRKWIDLVGSAEADRIKNRAGTIGRSVHKLNELYLLGKTQDIDCEYGPLVNQHHKNFRPYIDKVSTVYGTEMRLYSDVHRMAGTADLICKYDGQDTILDYKTKRKPQSEGWMTDYYIQATAYAVMYKELTGKEISQVVVLCSVEGTDTVQEFKSQSKWWLLQLHARLGAFDSAVLIPRKGMRVP